jgi:hypothetical protein
MAMHKVILLLMSIFLFIASLTQISASLTQTSITDAQRREQAARALSAAKKSKGSFRIITAQGNSKENLFVIDPAFGNETKRLEFLKTQDYKGLANDGFIAVVMKDGEDNYWLSRVCIDHFGSLEQLLRNGAEVKQSGPALGFSLLVTCNGLQIDKVVPESAAARADIRNGDYVLSLNGQTINTRPELADLLNREKAADNVILAVRRNGHILPIRVNLVEASNFKPSSPWQDAYSRRNYQLGITISQFRTLPYPDQKEWPNAYPVCTDDPRSQTYPYLADLYISSDWKSAGVVQCTFFYNDATMNRPLRAALMLGDLGSLTTFYFISEDGREEPRLFLIKSGGPSDSYESMLSTFVVAFGKPSKITQEQYQTKAGSVFPNEIATWENASSTMQLGHFGETTEVLQITHLLKPLMAVFDKKLAEGTARKAKKL